MHLDTRHFTFEVYEKTEQACREAFLAGLRKHQKDFPTVADDFIDDCMESATVTTVELGQFLRDSTALKLD